MSCGIIHGALLLYEDLLTSASPGAAFTFSKRYDWVWFPGSHDVSPVMSVRRSAREPSGSGRKVRPCERGGPRSRLKLCRGDEHASLDRRQTMGCFESWRRRLPCLRRVRQVYPLQSSSSYASPDRQTRSRRLPLSPTRQLDPRSIHLHIRDTVRTASTLRPAPARKRWKVSLNRLTQPR